MIEHKDWVWYGYPCHLIVGKRCVYHMGTRIGGFLISTVGDLMINGERETISGLGDYYFETMVFTCDGETKDGDPNVSSWTEIEGKLYKESIDAERGHRKLCQEYAEKQ